MIFLECSVNAKSVMLKEHLSIAFFRLQVLMLLLVAGCAQPNFNVNYEKIAQFSGEKEGIKLFFSVKTRGGIALPGDRYMVYVVNESGRTIEFDLEKDKYLYYTNTQVFRAHMFKVGGNFPRFVRPGEVVTIGIMTDRKGLSIEGFEVEFSKPAIKIFAGKIN